MAHGVESVRRCIDNNNKYATFVQTYNKIETKSNVRQNTAQNKKSQNSSQQL